MPLTEWAGKPVRGVSLGPVDVVFGDKTGKYPDGNLVVVTGRDARVVFDLPQVSRSVKDGLRTADAVVLGHVHEDHTAGLDLLPDKPVHVHEADVQALQSWDGLARHYGYSPDVNRSMCERVRDEFHFVPRPDARAYRDGARWDLGGVCVRAVHAPGHTSGHCILLVEPHGIAFIGDIDLSSFGPYYGDATSSLEAFRASLEQVRTLEARAWVTSHHKGVVTERERFLELLDSFGGVLARRDQALLDALGEGPRTLEELVAMRFVYPHSFQDSFVDDVERRMIGQHLDALVGQGAVITESGQFAVA